MSKNFFSDTFAPQTFTFFREKYSFKTFGDDLLAGFTLGAFSFPLAIAFAIASGVDPAKGLFTAIIAGFFISFFSGSKVQIGGPTGTMAILIINVLQKHGYDGVVIATLLAGLLLIFFGIMRLGTLIKYIPDTVTTGYATAIAIMIFSNQLIDFFGISVSSVPRDVVGKWMLFLTNISSIQGISLVIGVGSLVFLILMRTFFSKFPAAIIVVVLSALAVFFFDLNIDTIGSQFGSISSNLSKASLPAFSWAKTELVFHDAVMIALLIAIESIVSTSVSDGMSKGKTRYDCELISQGMANIASILFGGIPASGSLSRTVASVKMGAKTPIAGLVHAIVIAAMTFFLAPFLVYIPIPTIAAVLMMLAWNMFEPRHFINFFKAPRADLLVLLVTFGLILFADLMVGVEIGIVLSTSLFIKRMSENENAVRLSRIFSGTSKRSEPEALEKKILPAHVEVYEINGPFFFGIVERFKEMMNKSGPPPKVFILRMRKVPFVDATAMRAINELHDKCVKQNTTLLLSGVFGQAEKDLQRIGMEKKIGKGNIFRDIDSALQRTHQILQEGSALQEPKQSHQEKLSPILESST